MLITKQKGIGYVSVYGSLNDRIEYGSVFMLVNNFES